MELRKKYCNAVVKNVGLGICVYSIDKIWKGYILPTTGDCHAKVLFKLVIFKPFVGEILIGKLRSSDKSGIVVSLDFFDDVVISAGNLLQPAHFKPETNQWYWQFNEHEMLITMEGSIRLRVVSVEFNDKGDPLVPPMQVHGSIEEHGLGMI